MSNAHARFDLRLDPEIKKLASRASTLAGYKSLSEFVVQAVSEKSRQTIEEFESLKLTNSAFDDFWAACSQAAAPNEALITAKRRLDDKVNKGEVIIRSRRTRQEEARS